MSSENTALWDMLGRTDPAHTTPFKRGGGFTGTAIKPMWSYKRMTEEFGPCGIGWGVNEPTFQVVPGVNNEVLVYCTASIWYARGDEMARTIYGVGGDKIVTYIKANEQYKRPERWENDDEAFKKAFTDAITNALKLIGVGADVHMGLFDDSKYVNDMREEFSEAPSKKPGPAKRQVGINPKTGMATAHALKKDQSPDNWDAFQRELSECNTSKELTKLAMAWSFIADRDKWPAQYRDLAKEEINKRKDVLINGAPDADVFPGDLPAGVRQDLRQHPLGAG